MSAITQRRDMGLYEVPLSMSLLGCDDICMCVVNKQFELLEFVFDSAYVGLKYDEISLTFTAGSVSLWCVCSHLWSAGEVIVVPYVECGCSGCCD